MYSLCCYVDHEEMDSISLELPSKSSYFIVYDINTCTYLTELILFKPNYKLDVT